jgi:hypothetical protein
MCHHVHVTLSAENKKEAKKLAGVLLPVYASIVLAVTGMPRRGELIASSAPAAAR